MLDKTAWLTVCALIHPRGLLNGLRLGLCAAHTLLCTLLCSHVGSGRGHPPNSSWYAEALRVPFNGNKGPTKHHNPPSPKCYTWRSAVRKVLFSLQPPNPDSSIRQSREQISTSLESSSAMLYTAASNAFYCAG